MLSLSLSLPPNSVGSLVFEESALPFYILLKCGVTLAHVSLRATLFSDYKQGYWVQAEHCVQVRLESEA